MPRPLIVAASLAVALAALAPAHGQAQLRQHEGGTGDTLGSKVAGLGDITHDGVPDYALAAPQAFATSAGSAGYVEVRSGADGALLATLHGSAVAPAAGFGTSLAAAGDVNADGTPDIVVGEPASFTGATYGGEVWVFSGADFSVLYDLIGTDPFARLGDFLSGAGDANGDGHDDLLIHSAAHHEVFVVSGATGTVIRAIGQQPGQAGEFMTVAPAGDVNHDGFDDALVGAHLDSSGLPFAGSVRLFSGRDGSALLTWHGTEDHEDLGYALASAGDVNGDGTLDVIVSSNGFAASGASVRKVTIFSGADGSVLHVLASNILIDGFGAAVAGLGDVDGDGRDDVAVAAPLKVLAAGKSSPVYVYSGADAHLLMTLASDAGLKSFGISVSGVGDIDGDGHADVLVGSMQEPVQFSNDGAAYLYSGQPWSDLGFALAGAASAPQLTGDGTLLADSLTTLHLAHAPAGAEAVIVAGAGLLQAPFGGGTLVPTPDLVIGGLPITAAGTLDLRFRWPKSLAPTTVVRFQCWIPDAGSPQGYAASNAVSATQP